MSTEDNLRELKAKTFQIIGEMEENIDGLGETEALKLELLEEWKKTSSRLKMEIPCTEDSVTILDDEYAESYRVTFYLIVQYMLKDGDRVIVDILIDELRQRGESTAYLEKLKNDYQTHEEIIASVRRGDYIMLEGFLEENREHFSGRGKSLMFYCLSLKYLVLIKGGKCKEAIKFCNKNLKSFFQDIEYEKDIVRLLRLLVLKENIAPLVDEYTNKTIERLGVDISWLKGIPKSNTLHLLYDAGKEAIPELAKGSSTYSSQGIMKLEGDEIPIELSSKVRAKFHSLFVCPVLKVLCSDDNSPMLLGCGHVVSKDAVNKLSKFGTLSSFKCPYCPYDCKHVEIKLLRL